jgi:hypothetical protein
MLSHLVTQPFKWLDLQIRVHLSLSSLSSPEKHSPSKQDSLLRRCLHLWNPAQFNNNSVFSPFQPLSLFNPLKKHVTHLLTFINHEFIITWMDTCKVHLEIRLNFVFKKFRDFFYFKLVFILSFLDYFDTYIKNKF